VVASRTVLKERENLFWGRVREGMSAAAACESVGVNRRQEYRWIKAAGGRIHVPAVASSGRYMGQDERLRIADLRLGGAGVRAIARDLGRSASTISRELRRNPHPTTRSYRPYAAQKRCVIRAARPSPASSTVSSLPRSPRSGCGRTGVRSRSVTTWRSCSLARPSCRYRTSRPTVSSRAAAKRREGSRCSDNEMPPTRYKVQNHLVTFRTF
jgi:transposase-like protein